MAGAQNEKRKRRTVKTWNTACGISSMHLSWYSVCNGQACFSISRKCSASLYPMSPRRMAVSNGDLVVGKAGREPRLVGVDEDGDLEEERESEAAQDEPRGAAHAPHPVPVACSTW